MTALLSDGIDIALIGAETSVYVAGQNPNDPVVNFAQMTQKRSLLWKNHLHSSCTRVIED